MNSSFFKWLHSAVMGFFLIVCFKLDAHALPGSELVFKNISSKPGIALSFPLEDFLIAAPHLSFVANSPSLSALSEGNKARLADYFAEHLVITREGKPVRHTLQSIDVSEEFNEHVGDYKRVTARFSLNTQRILDDTFFPLELQFDAIMHEIRSHRTSVLFQRSQETKTVRLAQFVYQEVNGAPASHYINLPR